ncbi:MAG TPA: ice-binding family protein [Ilumatobacteraceae bacterium]|nr:ice-binding family protein [Ilumatobacteraceae bacterium]
MASRMVRVGIVAVPIAASFATALTLSSLTAVPSTFAGAAVRWLLIAAAATVVLAAVERVTRRLAPLATLLALSLTFPDRAPPRFRVALRNGSTRQLHERIAEARRGEIGNTPAEAAERVLELVAALSVHDRTTRGHSERVRAYSRMLGEELGLKDDELDKLQWAGLLHDVGKLLIPDAILNKPGRLNPAEYEEVCLHPEYGRGMVTALIPWLGESARAIWEHHERWDGGGYPAGLAGLDIALAARIVNVADTFDVMTSARSYKEPVTPAESRAELARCANGQFDPEVVRAFLNISIGQLRMVMGPISWLAQVPLFPASVLTGAVGGNAATVAATLAVFGAAAIGPMDLVDTSNQAAPGAKADSGYVVESTGQEANTGYVVESAAVTAGQITPDPTVSTSAAPWSDAEFNEMVAPSAESTAPIVAEPTPSATSPRPGPPVSNVPTPVPGLRAPAPGSPVDTPPSSPVDTPPSSPVDTPPSSPVVTVPPSPTITLPPVPVVDDTVVVVPPTPTIPRAASFVDLGAAEDFAVLAYAAVTSTGPTSITGNVGTAFAAITGLLPKQLQFGEIFDTSPTTATAARDGATAAMAFMTGLTASPLPGVELGGHTIGPGVYQGGTIELTGAVTLDAGGDPNAIFVFKAASTLVTASASRVVLVNGAQACNVFWQVGSSATFGTTTEFAGTVIAEASITATTGAVINGRLLALNAAVTLDSNTITVPTCD